MPCIHDGDVNADGYVSVVDVQIAFQILLGSYPATYTEECAADCNGDGTVSASDIQTLFMIVLGTGACADPVAFV